MQSFPLLAAFLLATAPCAFAQTTSDPNVDTMGAVTGTGVDVPAAGATDIDADEFHMDEVTHIGVFTGNVVVTGVNFNMKCQEMTVNFNKGGKIDTIVAKGNVVIIQPGRVTKCGQAVYHREEDMFDLTDQPVINDNGKTISAPEIIIHRLSQSLQTKGKSRVTIPEGSAFSPGSPDRKQP